MSACTHPTELQNKSTTNNSTRSFVANSRYEASVLVTAVKGEGLAGAAQLLLGGVGSVIGKDSNLLLLFLLVN